MTFAQRKKREAVVARFVKYLELQPNGCVYWTGAKTPKGYGRFALDGSSHLAHRVSYRLFVGRLKPNLLVRHSCDTPACVRPGHLSPGTALDNRMDCISRGRAVFTNNLPPPVRKFSVEQVRAIRDSLEPDLVVAKSFGVAGGSIYKIRARRSYAHVD